MLPSIGTEKIILYSDTKQKSKVDGFNNPIQLYDLESGIRSIFSKC